MTIKNLKRKEKEFREVRKMVRAYVDKKYNRLKKDDRERLVKEATPMMCSKLNLGYPIANSAIGSLIAENKLEQVLKKIKNDDITFVRRMIKIKNGLKVKAYGLTSKIRGYYDEEE